MRLGITGHRGLPEAIVSYVINQLRAEIARHRELVGVTCLADGADQLFAEAVLAAGGELTVIVPAEKYRAGLPAENHDTYDRLLERAADIIRLEYLESDSEAHMAASKEMLEHVDRLVAVWDGQPARGYGGTADVVHLAEERGVPILVIWPEGAVRP